MKKEAKVKLKSYENVEKYLVGELKKIRSLKKILIGRWERREENYEYPEIRRMVHNEMKNVKYKWQALKIVAKDLDVADSTIDQKYYAKHDAKGRVPVP